MKKLKKIAGLLTALCLLTGLASPGRAADAASVPSAIEKSAQALRKAVPAPQISSVGGEWAVIALARSGCSVPQSYWDGYYAAVCKTVAAGGGVLHQRKYTEYSRVILALTAIGADPADVAGYNLLTPLGDFEKTVWQGINGPIWALIALDAGGYDMPQAPDAAVQATRQMYVEEVLSRQLPDGGWCLAGSQADPDVTAMALQALAPYRSQKAVEAAVSAGLARLSAMQDGDGGYASWGAVNSESVVQVMTALGRLGVALDDSRFVKNGKTMLDNLLSYQLPDGSFCHSGQGGANLMASEQGLCGLAAAWRATEKKPGLFEMTDVSIKTASGGERTRHEDVKKVPVAGLPVQFSDVAGHENQKAIEALASRAIVSGVGAGQFAPDRTMTRAEFAAIVIRALGLPQDKEPGGGFSDVAADSWYAGFVWSASRYGIVQGGGDGRFRPDGTITRQEAAVMVRRAASLCGLDMELDDTAVRNVLAQFPDYTAAASWARESMAFCFQAGILDKEAPALGPQQLVRRCEVAQMLYNLLDRAELL